jgi:hypothetical protein
MQGPSLQRVFPKSLQEICDIVLAATKNARHVAMHAGHFLVCQTPDEDTLIPCIASEMSHPALAQLKKDVGYFPGLTWRFGLDLLSRFPSSTQKQVLILANDWQYVPAGVDRFQFYSEYQQLPQEYNSLLQQYPGITLLTPHMVGSNNNTGPFFSEQTLRNQFKPHFSKALAREQKDGATKPAIAGVKLAALKDAYCGKGPTSCAQEVAELLRVVLGKGSTDVFVNIYPLLCRLFVEEGTLLAYGLDAVSSHTVINIGMPSSGIKDEKDLLNSCEIAIFRHTAD